MATFEIRSNDNDTNRQLFINNQLACNLIYIPEGSFLREDGKIISVNSFYMSEFAVTQQLYKAVTRNDPSYFKGDQHPVEMVTWYDAVKFCGILNNGLKDFKGSELLKLNNLSNKELDSFVLNPASPGFRLPTEAEWEYAARGNAGNYNPDDEVLEFAGSNHLDLVGWYYENNGYETKPVGLLFPNKFGLYDMSGNVWEWCWDWYDNDFYKKSAKTNPVNINKGSRRVVRGGSWRHDSDLSRVAYRRSHTPGSEWSTLGFRLLVAFQFTSEPSK